MQLCALQAGNLSTSVINYRTEGMETMLHDTSNSSMWLANSIQTKNNSQKELTKEYLNFFSKKKGFSVAISQTKGDRVCRSELCASHWSPLSLLCALSVVFAKGGCKSRVVRDFDLHRPFSVMWLYGPEYNGTG